MENKDKKNDSADQGNSLRTFGRYPEGTTRKEIARDYYLQVAKDAEKAGNRLKARRYRAKAKALE